jgi:hypothetical protein
MLVSLLQRKNISIRKLKEMVFGPRTEKWGGTDGGEEKQTDGEEKAAEGGVKEERGSTESREKAVTRGHGRRAAASYTGARKVRCRHEGQHAGDHISNF